MLPCLQAEEKLDAINAQAIGSGQVEQQYRMRAIGQLQRKAMGRRFQTKKATARDLAGMGIGVRMAGGNTAAGQTETPASEPSEGTLKTASGEAGAEGNHG